MVIKCIKNQFAIGWQQGQLVKDSKMSKQWIILLTTIFLFNVSSAAEQKAAADDKKKPVQEAPKVEKGYVPKAEITIIEGEDRLVKEYRINGQLRAIKVTPSNGFPAYYLIDREGSGQFQKIGPDMGEKIVAPNWIVIEW